MRYTLEEKRKQYRIIYDILFKEPRVPKKILREILGRTENIRFIEALDLEYIVGPEIRIRSFKNLKEYLYLLKCQDPDLSYLKYRENPHVIFHTQMGGFSDLFIISKRKIDIDEDVMIEGYRTDYHVSYAPDHLWEKALENMWRKVEIFDPSATFQKNIIQDHYAETIEWYIIIFPLSSTM